MQPMVGYLEQLTEALALCLILRYFHCVEKKSETFALIFNVKIAET